MASYFAALNSAMAHRMSKPGPEAVLESWVQWWFEDMALWSEVARKADDPWAAERAYDFMDHARAEAERAAAGIPESRWPVAA